MAVEINFAIYNTSS